MERRIANPDMRATALELTKKSNLQHYYLRDGINPRNGVFAFMAIAVTLLAAVGAGAFGYLVAAKGNPPYLDLAWPYALMGGGFVGAFVGWLAFGKLVDASAPEYEAQMREDDRPKDWSLARAARSPRRIVLSENDKIMLQVFARRYPMVKTLAIGEWEGDTSPLQFDFISKRNAIKRIQQIVVGLELGTRDGRGGVNVVTNFDDVIIPDWQNGIFENPPTPNGRPSPAQEVAHE